MASLSDVDHYSTLCSRLDEFIRTALLQGQFEPSSVETERIYLALGAMFPGEDDVFAAFWDRLPAHRLKTVPDAMTGEELFVNLRLAPGIQI